MFVDEVATLELQAPPRKKNSTMPKRGHYLTNCMILGGGVKQKSEIVFFFFFFWESSLTMTAPSPQKHIFEMHIFHP